MAGGREKAFWTMFDRAPEPRLVPVLRALFPKSMFWVWQDAYEEGRAGQKKVWENAVKRGEYVKKKQISEAWNG